MKSPRSLTKCLLVLFTLIVASPAFGGRFHVAKVWYGRQKSEFGGKMEVYVFSRAVFRGKEELFPRSWIFQTMLNDSTKSTNLSDFTDPDYWGQGLTHTWSPMPGEEYGCGFGCAVEAHVPVCTETKEPVSYQGWAGIALYGDPADRGSSKRGGVEDTQCLFSVGGVVAGLSGRATVWLSNNDQDYIEVDAKGSGEFTFAQKLVDDGRYSVRIFRQPTDGTACYLDEANSAGRVEGHISLADVDHIRVRCTRTCHAGLGTVPPPGDLDAALAQDCNSAQLVDQGDGTVIDLANNLVWTRDFVGSGQVYRDQARELCGALQLGGRNDWRVPDIAQLQTLLPNCQGVMDNCVGIYFLDGTTLPFPVYHWSSSLYSPENDWCDLRYSCSWVIQFPHPDFDYEALQHKKADDVALVRCVTNRIP